MNKKLLLKDVLSPEIMAVLDDADVSYSLSEQDGKYIAELEYTSDFGGDQIHDIWFEKDNADETFVKGLKDVYDNFDVDEYVEMWLEAKRSGTRCPLNARQLVEDAESIETFLFTLFVDIRDAWQ